MLQLLVMSLAISWAGGGVHSVQMREPTHVNVSMRGVDFKDKRSTRVFYKRLKAAAFDACDSNYDDEDKQEDAKCARDALDRVLISINEPLLSDAAGKVTTIDLAKNTR